MSKNQLYVHHHLGLGDHFHCNGLIRYLSKKKFKREKIIVFAKRNYKAMIEFMYRDNKNISVRAIDNDPNIEEEQINIITKKNNYKIIKVGFDYFVKQSKSKKKMTIDMIFYKQLKIPFKYRFKYSYWKRDKKRENNLYKKLVKNKNYAFVHDDPSRNFLIKNDFINPSLQIIRNSSKVNIFDYGKILEKAKEIHVMESSIRCMLETLNTGKSKHFLYDFVGGPWKSMPFKVKSKQWRGTIKNWKLIKVNYKEKNSFQKIINKIFNNF